MDRQTVFISSWPKSGSTWLTRLLGDVLNSPTGGCAPEQDVREIATEGQDRPGAFVVRKGHFVLVDNTTMSGGKFRTVNNPVVPSTHRLAWEKITTERVVFLVRDPRDVCVSGAWHWQVTVPRFLEKMIAGDVVRCGRWDQYTNRHLEVMHNSHLDHTFTLVRYEDLLADTRRAVVEILDRLDLPACADRLDGAIYRQSFAVRKAQVGDDPAALRRNSMRKGIAGDWRNHFTPAMADRIWQEFGWAMEKVGYGLKDEKQE